MTRPKYLTVGRALTVDDKRAIHVTRLDEMMHNQPTSIWG